MQSIVKRAFCIAVGLSPLSSAALLLAAPSLAAQTQQKPLPPFVTMISPIYHQILAYQAPSTMLNSHEQGTATFFQRETVPTHESPEHWTQMITVNGFPGAVTRTGLSPKDMSERLAAGYKKGCPESFKAKELATTTVSGYPANVFLAGCGTVQDANGVPGKVHSEVTLMLIIKGEQDYYTIQWAERTPPVQTLTFDDAHWLARLKSLQPIRVCPIVPGEKAPYPSCIGK